MNLKFLTKYVFWSSIWSTGWLITWRSCLWLHLLSTHWRFASKWLVPRGLRSIVENRLVWDCLMANQFLVFLTGFGIGLRKSWLGFWSNLLATSVWASKWNMWLFRSISMRVRTPTFSLKIWIWRRWHNWSVTQWDMLVLRPQGRFLICSNFWIWTHFTF